jgi:LemA protein
MEMLFIVLGGLALLAFVLIGFYNGLIQLKVKVDEAWADIDTFLKQRYDMIPNLVNMVKGYMKHEQETLTKVTELRSLVAGAKTMEERATADNMLSSTLKTLFAVAENYPELKANENFLSLQTELTGLEDKLQMSRRFYNATVRDLNTRVEMFPGSLIAPMLGITKREFFEAAGTERENVKVSFDDEAPKAEVSSKK